MDIGFGLVIGIFVGLVIAFLTRRAVNGLPELKDGEYWD